MRPPAEAEAPAAFLYDTDWSARPPQNPRSSTRLLFSFLLVSYSSIFSCERSQSQPFFHVDPAEIAVCGNRYSQSNPLCAHTPGISLGKLEQIPPSLTGQGE